MKCEECKEDIEPIKSNGYWVCPVCGVCVSDTIFSSEQTDDFKSWVYPKVTPKMKSIEYRTKRAWKFDPIRVNFDGMIDQIKSNFDFLPLDVLERVVQSLRVIKKNHSRMKMKSCYSVLLYIVSVYDTENEYLPLTVQKIREILGCRLTAADIRDKISNGRELLKYVVC